jgi:hypothetical protein
VSVEAYRKDAITHTKAGFRGRNEHVDGGGLS